MKNILVTGGTGLVGRALVARWGACTITTRDEQAARNIFPYQPIEFIQWPSTNRPVDLSRVKTLHGVVNLMGESVADGRWNANKKQRIRDSRVEATSQLIASLASLSNQPAVFLSASAVGYYGDCGEQRIEESRPPGDSFLADVCQQWEARSWRAAELGLRTIVLRLGIVLSTQGGALAKQLPIFRRGLGGKIGSGKQFVPWIHIDDLVSMIVWALENESVSGVYNAVAPHGVTNSEFTQQLSRELKKPAVVPVPRCALRLALGEFGNELLSSQRVVPAAAVAQGFEFQFPDIQSALRDLLENGMP